MIITKPIILLILDGWGYAPPWGGNAITQSRTQVFDKLWREFPHTTLGASGQFVGLPGHEQGNSEVGHLNIGSGRVVHQDIKRINQSITDGSFFSKSAFLEAIDHCQKNKSNLHLMGLISDSGVHSHINHLYALMKLAKNQGFEQVYIHAFTDGRDTPPMSSLQYLTYLENKIKELKIGTIATICGRYWAMDRDKHWDRINQAYRAMAEGIGPFYHSALEAVSANYKNGHTDEFIIPSVIVDKTNKPIAKISAGDAVIFFNFRSDRARQITTAFCAPDFKEFNRQTKIANLAFITIIPYGMERELGFNTLSAFQTENLQGTLAEILSTNGLSQFHIAETEKYAHVTYFFNGGRENPFENEDRLMIPSPKVPTFDLKPEMSVYQITDELIDRIKRKKYNFIVANFANPDMVGHTGNLKAAIDACESVDINLQKVYNEIVKEKGVLIVTADHGNVEQMLDPRTGQIDTGHTTNPVPFILINGPKIKVLKQNGVLADIAPTILRLMGIRKSPEMTGEPLVSM